MINHVIFDLIIKLEYNPVMLEFDVDKTVQYWTEGAEYDMGVADAMYKLANTLMLCLWGIWQWKNC